jgi:helix-turn-helix protein
MEMSEQIEKTEIQLADDKPLTDEEVAGILEVSPRTVQRLRLSKKLKSVRITSKISRITVKQVKEYLRQKAA